MEESDDIVSGRENRYTCHSFGEGCFNLGANMRSSGTSLGFPSTHQKKKKVSPYNYAFIASVDDNECALRGRGGLQHLRDITNSRFVPSNGLAGPPCILRNSPRSANHLP